MSNRDVNEDVEQDVSLREDGLRERITGVCRSELNMPALEPDQDFFDFGANSLSIVALQIRLEKELALSVPTSTLMLDSSIAGWTRAYAAAAATSASDRASLAT